MFLLRTLDNSSRPPLPLERLFHQRHPTPSETPVSWRWREATKLGERPLVTAATPASINSVLSFCTQSDRCGGTKREAYRRNNQTAQRPVQQLREQKCECASTSYFSLCLFRTDRYCCCRRRLQVVELENQNRDLAWRLQQLQTQYDYLQSKSSAHSDANKSAEAQIDVRCAL